MSKPLTLESAAWAVAALVLLLLLPMIFSATTVDWANEVIYWAILCLGVNLVLGYMGYVSLGHAMFIGTGAYFLALFVDFAEFPLGWSIPLVVVGTTLLGLVVGAIVMRVNRIQFLVITLAIAELIHGVFHQIRATGGDDGHSANDTWRVDLTWFGGWDTSESAGFYYWNLLCLLAVMLVLWRFLRSPFGSVLVGIRENEQRMTALGYNIAFYKIMAFAVSGAAAGVAGILYAQNLQSVNPEPLTWQVSGEALLMVIIGGRKYFIGPVLGAAFYIVVKHLLESITSEYIIFLGLAFMAIVAFFGRGIAGYFVDLYIWAKRRAGIGRPGAPVAEAGE